MKRKILLFSACFRKAERSHDYKEVYVSITHKDEACRPAVMSLSFEENEGTVSYSAIIDQNTNNISSSEKAINGSGLVELDENYKTLYNLTFEGVIIHDKGITLDANPAFMQMMGLRPGRDNRQKHR